MPDEERDERIKQVLLTVLDNVERVGWHATGVFPSVNDPPGTMSWMYTTGLAKSQGHPDLILFNLPPDVGHGVLASAVDVIVSGTPLWPGEDIGDVLVGYPVRTVEVPAEAAAEHMGMTSWFHDHEPFTAVQIVCPDKDGRFPWDAGYAGYEQPVLGEVQGG